MRITEIKKLRKHLSEIWLDTGRVFSIDSDLCREKELVPDGEINKAQINEYILESDFKRAVSRSVWYIERGDLTERKLAEKLKNSGFKENSSARAVERMKELGLINDAAYAKRLAENLLSQCVSSREALFKMANKGVPRDLARQTLDMFECDPCQQIKAIIRKKYYAKLADKESEKKVFAALMRKGFSYADIKSALKEFTDTEYSEE